jgi:hypothetical protein
MAAVVPSYKGFRYPVEIISHCVWLYHRFPLSFREGTVKLLVDKGSGAALGQDGWLWRCGQAAAGASPVTWFQVVNLAFISCRYWAAVSRWRRGRKCGDIPLNADRNRWAPPAEWNRFIARSRCLVGWWEFSARLFKILRSTMLHAG